VYICVEDGEVVNLLPPWMIKIYGRYSAVLCLTGQEHVDQRDARPFRSMARWQRIRSDVQPSLGGMLATGVVV